MTALRSKQPSQPDVPPAAREAPQANGHPAEAQPQAQPLAASGAAPRGLSPRMAAMLPKSLSRSSSPRKAALGHAEAAQSSSLEPSGTNPEASTAATPATVHELASASDSSRSSGVRDHSDHAQQAPMSAPEEEVAAGSNRHNRAESTAAAMSTQQQGLDRRDSPQKAAQRQVPGSRDTGLQSEPAAAQSASQPVAFATQHEIAAAQDRQYPTEYTAAAVAGVDRRDGAPQSEPGPPQQQRAAAPNLHTLPEASSATASQTQEALDSRGSASQPEPIPAHSAAHPDAPSGRHPGFSGATPQHSQSNGSADVIQIAEPVNGLNSRAREHEEAETRRMSADENNTSRSGRSSVKFGRALPGMVSPERTAQTSSASQAADHSLSPSDPQSQAGSKPASSAATSYISSNAEEQRARDAASSAADGPQRPTVSGSQVKSGRPLPSITLPSNFPQASTGFNDLHGSPSNPEGPPHARLQDGPSAASQPELSMQPDEAHEQLSEPGASDPIRVDPDSASRHADDPRHGRADDRRQQHRARGSSPTAQQDSPSKVRLAQAQPPGASAFDGKQPADGEASRSEESSATIKAKHLDGPATQEAQGDSRSQPSQPSQISHSSSSMAESRSRDAVPGAQPETSATASGPSSQHRTDVSSEQDNRSFSDAREAIARATASGQGSVAEAALAARSRSAITRSALFPLAGHVLCICICEGTWLA